MARWARDAAPKPVSTSQLDPISGKINWPAALTQSSYADQRAVLDQLTTKEATYGRLSYSDQLEARNAIEAMFGTLKSQITAIPPMDYMASRDFLRSLIYATSKSLLE